MNPILELLRVIYQNAIYNGEIEFTDMSFKEFLFEVSVELPNDLAVLLK